VKRYKSTHNKQLICQRGFYGIKPGSKERKDGGKTTSKEKRRKAAENELDCRRLSGAAREYGAEAMRERLGGKKKKTNFLRGKE